MYGDTDQIATVLRTSKVAQTTVASVYRSTNIRIVFCMVLITAIMGVIAAGLSDFLQFSRAYAFFDKIFTGQSVTSAEIPADQTYSQLLPKFQQRSDDARAVALSGERLQSAGAYVGLIDEYLAQITDTNLSDTNLFSGFTNSIRALQPGNTYQMECSLPDVPFFVDHNIPYRPVGGPIKVAPVMRYCQFDGTTITDGEISFPLVTVTVLTTTELPDAVSKAVSNGDLRIGLTALRAAIEREVSSLKDRQTKELDQLQLAENDAKKAIEPYVEQNKVNVTQDVSFIVSRAFLLVALVSLAGTCLRIILNEIRFSNRVTELRIASDYSLLHASPSILTNLYKSQTRDGEISKSDADAGLSSKDVKELLTSAIGALTKKP